MTFLDKVLIWPDSTNIANFTGKLDFGYNIKIKNKRSIKISIDERGEAIFKIVPSLTVTANEINIIQSNKISVCFEFQDNFTF